MKTLPIKLKIYLITLIVVTVVSIFFLIVKNNVYISSGVNINNVKELIFFSLLMGLTESFTVSFKGMYFSTSFAINIASFVLYGPLFTIIVAVMGISLSVLKIDNKYKHIFNIPIYKTLYNYCSIILPILYGNYIFVKMGGIYSIDVITKHPIPIILFCLINFFIGVLAVSILGAVLNKKSLIFFVFVNTKMAALNFLAMAPLGLIGAVIFNSYHYFGFILFTFPILMTRFTFSLFIEAKTKYIQTVDVIMHAMEARDKYTEGHSKRVAEISYMIATELKYNEWKLEDLNISALLHDVGKIGIDDQILNKPGKLTDEEYNIIKGHPEIGYRILKEINDIDNVKAIVKYHHERYDGMGYPEGKKHDELSLDVFIVQLADSIDAMATNRPYRSAMNEEEILNEINKCKGTQFHPIVVDAYLRAFEKQKKH